MIAVDTNVVVRLLTGDHPEQSARARALVESTEVHLTLTVILETERVLRSAYGFSSDRVVSALTAFAGLPTVSVERPVLLAGALDRARGGMDFADAVHLGGAEGCDGFATFDRRLIGSAAALGLETVREP